MCGYTVAVLDVRVVDGWLAGWMVPYVGFWFFLRAQNGAWQPRVQRKQTSRLTKREQRARVKRAANQHASCFDTSTIYLWMLQTVFQDAGISLAMLTIIEEVSRCPSYSNTTVPFDVEDTIRICFETIHADSGLTDSPNMLHKKQGITIGSAWSSLQLPSL